MPNRDTSNYCAGLIAQVTLTLIDNCSSPGATGVGAIAIVVLLGLLLPGLRRDWQEALTIRGLQGTDAR